nr:probable phospholipid hydroperoxide glutathione peroxidase [Tanacetum cinerariifolium]
GKEADPLYKFLKSSKGGFLGDSIKWNFTKFLVDREGKVVDRYAPTTSPLSIEKDIKKLLNKYKDQGLEVLAFPCNQFGGQEPGSNEEIQEFACTRFKAEYPVFSK